LDLSGLTAAAKKPGRNSVRGEGGIRRRGVWKGDRHGGKGEGRGGSARICANSTVGELSWETGLS